jgi:MFS family permease
VVPEGAYGRAYGFERAMDNLGAIGGPLLALGLVAAVGIRGAILASIIPGLLAALAIVYAVRHLHRPRVRERAPIRLRVRPVLEAGLGRLLAALAAFEVGNVAATLLILRATQLLTPGHGPQAAAVLALGCYTASNLAATLASVPAGRAADRRGARLVLAAGVALFLLAYAGLALTGASLAVLAACFVAAGAAIGCVETAEHAAVAVATPARLRGSAFGLLAAIQSVGNLAASGIAGLLWTWASPRVAFGYLAGWMVLALIGLVGAGKRVNPAA